MSKVDLRLQCGMPCSKLEVSTAQHGTLSGTGYLHQSQQWMYQGAFLMRGLANVRAEFSLTALAYNLRRALNILGVEAMTAAVAA